MKAKLNRTILGSIHHDICTGRPLWGLLRANEYLEPNSPIRKALVTKAKQSLQGTTYTPLRQIVERTIDGDCLAEMPEALYLIRQEQLEPPRSSRSQAGTLARHLSFQERKERLRNLAAA